MVELNRKFLDKQYGIENLLNLTEIDVHGNRNQICNQITKIDSNTFKNLTKLEILLLGGNEIKYVDGRLFESLSNLKELSLYNNKLKSIDPNTLKNLKNLEILTFAYNEIEEIDVKLFKNLSNLKRLYLNNNRVKRINSDTFKSLKKLETLRLGNNEIEDIDVRLFESLSNLKELSLWNNKLKRIDSNTFKKLTKLEKLYLHDNAIEDIDMKLTQSLINLKELRLYNNKLKKINRECFEPLKSVEFILLYENAGLNALSFIKPSANIWYNEKEKVEKYGFVSEWNKFLQQFPDLIYEKLIRVNEQREAASRQRIAEENNRKAKLEQENANKSSSSSSSNNQSTNKDKSKRFQDPYIGEFLNDRYKVVKKIGKGSFGSVYLVDDTKIDIKSVREKAIKVMDKLDSATENELELSSKIIHENIVRYFDHFHMSIEGENQTFLITEYCQNGDLKKRIEESQKSGKNFDDRQLLEWICQATNALKYLHSKKPDPIIHRDIKPANMLLTERNEIKLADLGLSKIMDNTHASSYKGSPAYMSPEVFKSQVMVIKYYPNTDIWL